MQYSLCVQVSSYYMEAVGTLEDIESTCISSFVLGDHHRAAQLLPSLQQPAAVRTSYTFTENKFQLRTNVSLLHLAALHGWMNIVANLVSMSDCDIQCCDNREITPLHYAAHGGSLPVVKYLVTEQHCDPNCRGELGRVPLHYACDKGHMDIIKYLITEQGCDPALPDNDGDMPIHFACLGGQLNVVQYLITEMKCNPKCPRKDGRTPLHHACNKGHIDIIKYLITEQGCNPALPDNDGNMPIHIACLGGQLNVVKYLITEMKCNPKCPRKDGRTPLHHACDNGHMDIIKYLITEQGCDPALPDNDGDMPIHIACLGGHLNVVKYLITEMKCNPKCPREDGRTPLHHACGNGHMDVIKYLITEQGCDPALPDNDGDMPIHIACLGGHLNVVKYLITEMKCNPKCPRKDGRTPLHHACDKGHMDIIKYLITEQGCDPALPDNDGDMPIHIACIGGQLNVVKYLITEMKCNPKCPTEDGQTPLHHACGNGHMDVIKYLITEQGCDPALPDNDGDMPIHIACLFGQLNVVKYLITEMKCNPKCPRKDGRTPLHHACDKGHMDIIKYLITEQGCDPALPDNDGDMPIHIACLGGHLNVVKYLITEMKCSPKCPAKDGRKPLHHACDKGHMDIIKYLITEHGCDPALPDNDGDMPIHIACLGGHLNVVKYLITEMKCNPKCPKKKLHHACGKGHMDIIKYLITEQGCDPALPDNDGDMPIHFACLGGHLNVVKYLITEMKCNPKCQKKNGRTPLHHACDKGHMDIIKYLITEQGCDPALPDNDGDMPIHFACLGGQLNVVKYLITEMKCNPKCPAEDGRTPLHHACDKGHMDIIKYLITENGCDPALPDNDGDMPIHFACLGGQLNVVKYLITEQGCDPAVTVAKCLLTPLHLACVCGHTNVVQFLMQDRRVDALSFDKFGRTPVNFAELSDNSYQLLKLFKPLLNSRKDYPIHSFAKVVLTGNSGAGKSSLAEVMIAKHDTVSYSQQRYSKSMRNSRAEIQKVTKVETLTAGIDSYVVKSEVVGNMVLYDLAGQSEYYFSQSVIMETVIRKTPAIFINLVDLSKSEDKIEQAVHHWLTFIENATSKTHKKSCIVMVGSHTDLLSKQQLETKTTLVKDLVERRVKKQKYEGFVGMDCRKVNAEMTNTFFPHLLDCHSTVSAYSQPVSVYCHMLYAFLQTVLDKTACQLQELVSSLAAEDNSIIPSNVPFLCELLEDLSDKGVIIYLKNEQFLEESWVVVKREIILKDVNGELFKPKYFKGYHPIASSTGIIRISSLRELFPQYDPEMLVELMVRLEFCHPVNISGFTTNLQPISVSTSIKSSTEVLLFFPSLLKAERPQGLTSCEHELSQQVRFGWCLGCKDYEYQFLTSRFLHVLLLRLAYTFPLPSEKYTETHNLHKIERICTVWINGISWNNVDGIRTVVEVIQQNRWVVVTMCYNKDITRPVKYSKHRSAVIRLVLELQKELAPDMDTFECLISPSLLQQWPLEHLPESDLFPIKNVTNCLLLNNPVILSCDGSNQLITKDAVLCEPYHLLSPPSVCELMDSSKSDQPVSPALLNQVKGYCALESQSHLSLRKQLDTMSIFTGRSPLVSSALYTDGIVVCYCWSGIVHR